MKKRSFAYIFPALLVIFLDAVFTILGQPDTYWLENFYAHEGSPLGFNLLRISPWAFLSFMSLYLGLAFFLLKKLPFFWALVLGLSLFSGHLYGSGSWIYPIYLKFGLPDFSFVYWYTRIGYYIIICFFSGLIINKEVGKK